MAIGDITAHGRESDRFWGKVKKTDGCWVWTAGRDNWGYGQFNRKTPKGWQPIKAHRWAWIERNGQTELCLLHRCDNRVCVRPDHLFTGTRRDNALDRDAKGRTFNGNAKRTHCIHSHEFTEANTYRYRGHRACRTCRNRLSNKPRKSA
jgi:hypothetical protein